MSVAGLCSNYPRVKHSFAALADPDSGVSPAAGFPVFPVDIDVETARLPARMKQQHFGFFGYQILDGYAEAVIRQVLHNWLIRKAGVVLLPSGICGTACFFAPCSFCLF
jgi:hypothetical protein